MGGAEKPALREYAGVFDGVAAAYDAIRPSYPPELVAAAIEAGALDGRSNVLEIGSGTGKLTELLIGGGLRVHAVEPGANLVEVARQRVGATAPVHFEIARFEDADLRKGSYDAVFSATAFHWVEPSIGWRKVADVLSDDGVLALLTHIPIHDERSAAMELETAAMVREHASGIGTGWTIPQTLEAAVAAAHAQRANASAVWDTIMGEGRHSMTVPEAAGLFADVDVTTVLEQQEWTADAVLAHLRTTSFYFMLPEDGRQAFEEAYRDLIDRHGGTYPFSDAAVLMTARRFPGLPRD